MVKKFFSRHTSILAAIVAFIIIGCTVHHPTPVPPAPPMRTIAVALNPQLPNVGVTLNLDGVVTTAHTNASGYFAFEPVLDCPNAHQFTIHVDETDHYKAADLGPLTDCHNHEVDITLSAKHLDAGIHQRVRIVGEDIIGADGTKYTLHGFSDFSLLQRFMLGQDVGPILDNRIKAGANLLRVFTMYTGTPGDKTDQGIGNSNGLGRFIPSPATYPAMEQLATLAREYGLLIEYVGIADEQVLNINVHQHMDAIFGAVGNDDNVLVEVCNEPFKNGCDVTDKSLITAPHTVSIAFGDYNICWDAPCSSQPPIGDYLTWHSSRDDDWYNDGRAAGNIRDGKDAWGGARVVVFADEPMGYGETSTNPSGSHRETSADSATWAGGIFALFGPEATFHSDNGINSELMGPVTEAAARNFFSAMSYIPYEAQFAPYQRGCAGGGACIGDMPIDHRDLEENTGIGASRTYCKTALGFEFCIASNPEAGWTPRPLRGCTVVDQPFRGFVKLSCPTSRPSIVETLFSIVKGALPSGFPFQRPKR